MLGTIASGTTAFKNEKKPFSFLSFDLFRQSTRAAGRGGAGGGVWGHMTSCGCFAAAAITSGLAMGRYDVQINNARAEPIEIVQTHWRFVDAQGVRSASHVGGAPSGAPLRVFRVYGSGLRV